MRYVVFMITLSAEQKKFWNNNRYLLFKNCLSPELTRSLSDWTQELNDWPETPGKWMKYFEKSSTDSEKKLLCRVENFIPFHDGFRKFLTDDNMIRILSELMNEEAILYKEKINFKMPGGGGFAAHQDAPAFTTFGQKYHVTLMVAIDPCTPENGCLEIVNNFREPEILKQAEDGTIDPEVIAKLKWIPLRMNPGDMLLFDSFVPHRSGPNLSLNSRRALYITYNRASEGNFREDYFREKRKVFPPEVERVPGVALSEESRKYNLGNPIR